jgi:hypothetical protein
MTDLEQWQTIKRLVVESDAQVMNYVAMIRGYRVIGSNFYDIVQLRYQERVSDHFNIFRTMITSDQLNQIIKEVIIETAVYHINQLTRANRIINQDNPGIDMDL